MCYPLWPIKWSSLKITTASHLHLQILLEQKILAWHRRLFKNKFAGWGTKHRLWEKSLGLCFCNPQAQRTASNFSACNKLQTMLFGATETVFCPSAEGVPILPALNEGWNTAAHTSANWQPSSASCILFTHPMRNPPRQHKHTDQGGVKEMCKISTNRYSEDKAVWLSPGTLRHLINY